MIVVTNLLLQQLFITTAPILHMHQQSLCAPSMQTVDKQWSCSSACQMHHLCCCCSFTAETFSLCALQFPTAGAGQKLGSSLASIWCVLGNYLARAWQVLVGCLVGVQLEIGGCLVGAWWLLDGYLVGSWRMIGACLAHV